MNWYNKSGDAIFKALSTSRMNGLTDKQARNRLAKFGPNQLKA
ncbi:cation-transporting P-type ATPase [Lentilactobacillus farraginis]|nr:cation-transporting P-type ATPase [Lentilactobacillus farraginis]